MVPPKSGRSPSTKSMAAFTEWPKELEDNKVSTTKHGKRIFGAAFKALGKTDAIKRMDAEKDWRHQYGKYMEELAEAMAASPDAARAAAMAGLTAVHSAFGSTAKMQKPGRAFETLVVDGDGGGADGVLVDLEQVKAWSDHGACEPSVLTRCEAMSSSAAGLRVPDRVLGSSGNAFVVLGATAEMGPTKTLLTLGCTVVAVARRGVDVGSTKWKDLIAFAKASPGTLVAPCEKVAADLDNQAVHCGADVLADAPAIARWLLADDLIRSFKTLVVGSYVYLDGEKHVRASVACDAIVTELFKSRGAGGLCLAYLASPGTVYPISQEMQIDSLHRYTTAPAWQGRWSALGSIGGAGFAKNARAPVVADDGAKIYLTSGLVTVQGPNYALAKTLQNWRCVVSHYAGCTVSANMAPPARTKSMTGTNPNIARWLDGVANFEPNGAFDPAVASVVMTALLLYDLSTVDCVASPKGHDALPNPMMVLQPAFHGGSPRCAFTSDSIGTAAAIASFPIFNGGEFW